MDCVYEPNAEESCAEELSKLSPTAADKTSTDPIHTPAINESTTAYSMAVAASSDSKNLIRW